DLEALTLGLEADDARVDRVLRVVDVLDEILEPARVVVGPLLDAGALARGVLTLAVLLGHPLVAEHDRQALVEERHLLEPARHGLGVVLGGLEDLGVGPERDRRAAALRGPGVDQLAGLGVLVVLGPAAAVAVDVDVEPGRQRVDHGHAHAVQTTRHRVRVTVELAARVQHRQHDLDRGALLLGVQFDGDTAAVVHDAHAAVGHERDLDPRGVPGHRLVDRVVHDLLDQVVQAALTGGPDVHAGAFADGLEPLEDRDGGRTVFVLVLSNRPDFSSPRHTRMRAGHLSAGISVDRVPGSSGRRSDPPVPVYLPSLAHMHQGHV